MTVCQFCLRDWAARSEDQLANRFKNLSGIQGGTIAPCPHCGGVEWATTDQMIQPEAQTGWLRRFLKRWIVRT